MKSGKYLHRPLNRLGEDLGTRVGILDKVDPRAKVFCFFQKSGCVQRAE